MMTKEEIQRSIIELQYQYQALIREGSYKLAKIRKERIKKLREQLKQLSKTKVQDSMDILRLCGYTNDECPTFTKGSKDSDNSYTLKESDYKKEYRSLVQKRNNLQQGSPEYKKVQERLNQIRGKISGDPFKDEDPSVKSLTYKGYTIRYRPSSGKYYISSGPGDTVSLKHIGKEYANLNEAKYSISNNDKCPTFTKGSKDDDATEHGSIEQYGKGTKTESMGLSKDPVLAQDGSSTWEKRQDWLEEQIRKLSKYGDRYNQQKLRAYKEEYDAITRRLSSTKDGGPGSGIKGHRTPEKEEPKKAKASTKLTPSQKEVARYLSEEAELSSPEEIKKAFGEEAPDSYKKSYNNALNFPVGSKAYVGSKKVEIEDYMSDDDGEVIYAMLSNGGMVDASKLRSNKPTKDADPKVAEAQAIINLCSGIF